MPQPASPNELVDRLFGATLTTMDLFSVYLGDRLGYYRALAEAGPATSTALAERTSTAERYTREWLEQQAATGILFCENPEADPVGRRFSLPDGYEAVLVDPESLYTMTPSVQIMAGCVKPLSQIVDAYRTGGGVPYADYGVDLRQGQAAFTRPGFVHQLAQEWLPSMPDVHARLLSDPPARVADIGMGEGLSSIAIAQGYPKVKVDGFDLHAASVAAAQAHAEEMGVADRVMFHACDAAKAEWTGQYDLALAIECIHDMADPVAVLRTMRDLVGESGPVLIVDEKVADQFMAPGDDVERLMYGYSILHCLPVGMADQPSVGTGTVMREPTMRRYATAAGFQTIDLLPVTHDFFHFYRLQG